MATCRLKKSFKKEMSTCTMKIKGYPEVTSPNPVSKPNKIALFLFNIFYSNFPSPLSVIDLPVEYSYIMKRCLGYKRLRTYHVLEEIWREVPVREMFLFVFLNGF